MAIDVERLLARTFAPVEHAYGPRDTMLYALGLGIGADPVDTAALRYVYEGSAGGLLAVPTMINVLGYGGFWADQPDTGITWRKLVHAEQAIELYAPLPAKGRVIGHNRVAALYDKGADKGALMVQERKVVDAETGALLATVTQTSMLRGDGGFGTAASGSGGPPAPHAMPPRPADMVCDLQTLPQAALLYRLNGDYNPLHADPAVAAVAGFSRPILHGLATMGVAMHAALRSALAYDATRVRAMRVRFTAPVLPGETLRTELWQDGNVLSLRTTALERAKVVLDFARVEMHGAQPSAN